MYGRAFQARGLCQCLRRSSPRAWLLSLEPAKHQTHINRCNVQARESTLLRATPSRHPERTLFNGEGSKGTRGGKSNPRASATSIPFHSPPPLCRHSRERLHNGKEKRQDDWPSLLLDVWGTIQLRQAAHYSDQSGLKSSSSFVEVMPRFSSSCGEVSPGTAGAQPSGCTVGAEVVSCASTSSFTGCFARRLSSFIFLLPVSFRVTALRFCGRRRTLIAAERGLLILATSSNSAEVGRLSSVFGCVAGCGGSAGFCGDCVGVGGERRHPSRRGKKGCVLCCVDEAAGVNSTRLRCVWAALSERDSVCTVALQLGLITCLACKQAARVGWITIPAFK